MKLKKDFTGLHFMLKEKNVWREEYYNITGVDLAHFAEFL